MNQWWFLYCRQNSNSNIVPINVQPLPKVSEHLLWFMLQTSYKTPSPVKQCCVKKIWITLQVEVMQLKVSAIGSTLYDGGRGFALLLLTQKGKGVGKSKKVLLFQVLLAGIVDINFARVTCQRFNLRKCL